MKASKASFFCSSTSHGCGGRATEETEAFPVWTAQFSAQKRLHLLRSEACVIIGRNCTVYSVYQSGMTSHMINCAVYLCVYGALYPATSHSFQALGSRKVHDLDLVVGGRELQISVPEAFPCLWAAEWGRVMECSKVNPASLLLRLSAVPRHTYGGIGDRGCIAPTHCRLRH
jgi:hypothetical protein